MTENPAARRRFTLPVPEAIEEKWQAGRALYGPEWQGDEPAIECHDELLDALAYLGEEQRTKGPHPELSRARVFLVTALNHVRSYMSMTGGR